MANIDDDISLFLVIYRFMWSEMGLSGVTLHVYARIYGFCRNGGLFYESRSSTARFLGTTPRTVSRSISELLACGLIHEQGEHRNSNGTTTRSYSIDTEALKRASSSRGHPESDVSATYTSHDKPTPDESSPPDEMSWKTESNPDGSSGNPVTGCHPIKKEERNNR
jgi:hypothetical protein